MLKLLKKYLKNIKCVEIVDLFHGLARSVMFSSICVSIPVFQISSRPFQTTEFPASYCTDMIDFYRNILAGYLLRVSYC